MPFFPSRPTASIFTDEEIRTAPPERKAWMRRILELAHLTGASLELARQAVEDADDQHPQTCES